MMDPAVNACQGVRLFTAYAQEISVENVGMRSSLGRIPV